MTGVIIISTAFGLWLLVFLIIIWDWFKYKLYPELILIECIADVEANMILAAQRFVKLGISAHEAGIALQRLADTLNDVIDNKSKGSNG